MRNCSLGAISPLFHNILLPVLDYHVKTETRISLRHKRLFEISEVEITRVDCILKCCVLVYPDQMLCSVVSHLGTCMFFFFFFFFFFLIWVLRPFQEYFTYIELIVHRRWAKTGVPGEKPPDHP